MTQGDLPKCLVPGPQSLGRFRWDVLLGFTPGRLSLGQLSPGHFPRALFLDFIAGSRAKSCIFYCKIVHFLCFF